MADAGRTQQAPPSPDRLISMSVIRVPKGTKYALRRATRSWRDCPDIAAEPMPALGPARIAKIITTTD